MQTVTEESENKFINRIVAIILSTGMYVTIGLYAIGVILALVENGHIPRTSHQYFPTIVTFVTALAHLDARAFLYLGTVALILTPVSRVFVSILAFWKEHDFRYVTVTTIVFLVILTSVIVGSVFKINIG